MRVFKENQELNIHQGKVCQVVDAEVGWFPTKVDGRRMEETMLIIRNCSHLSSFVNSHNFGKQSSSQCRINESRISGVDIQFRWNCDEACTMSSVTCSGDIFEKLKSKTSTTSYRLSSRINDLST